MKTTITKRLSSSIFAIFVLILFCAMSLQAGPGDLDPTFGTGGKFTDWQGFAHAVAIQSDGKIVAAGQSQSFGCCSFFSLTRYNTDGSLDTSFGTSGRVVTSVGGESWAKSVAIQADGKIVAAGVSSVGSDNFHFALARYNPNGSLDTSFDGDGKVTTFLGTSVWDDEIHSVAIQPDGRIVVAGLKYVGIGDTSIALARYNTNGSLDTSFDGDGIVITPGGPSGDGANAVAIQPDGKIVIAGYSRSVDNDFLLARYNANGSFDAVLIASVGTSDDGAYSVSIQPDGKIVAAGVGNGWTKSDFAIVRYNANLSLDTTFDGDGKVTTPVGTSADLAYSVAIQPDGKIVAAGLSHNGANNDFALVRYNPNGSLDTTLGGGDGKTTVDFNNTDDLAFGMALDGEGRAVVAGGWTSPWPGAFELARFQLEQADARTPFDYDGDGKTDVSVFRPSSNEWHIMQSSGGIRVQGWGLAGDKMTPADFDGDGKTDLAVFRPAEGNWYILNSSNNTVTGAGWGVLNDLPVPADYNGDGKADLVVYRPSNRNWYRRDSDGLIHVFEWGLADDRPAPADFTGDGRTDMVVFRPSEGKWYVLSSSDFSVTTTNWGVSGDVPVAADYSGDGKADFVVFRPSDLTWYRRNTDDGSLHFITWGLAGDIPTPGDYDGDGKTDLAVYRPSNGTWYIFGSASGIYSQPFGLAADLPTPNAFVY